MAGFKNPNFLERQEAAAKAKKAALEKFLAKAADPALAERLTARTAGAADRRAVRNVREAEKAESQSARMPNARCRRSATPRLRQSAPRPNAPSANWRCKPSKKRRGTPAMPPANPNRSASN